MTPVARRAARGVSLIEVLVSLVILSMGVLAVVGLQLISKRNNADAGQRTIAAQLAYDMVERMRANASTTTLPEYLVGLDTAPVGDLYATGEGPAVPTCNSEATPCTPAEVVERDLWAWEEALEGAAETTGGDQTGGLVSPLGCIAQFSDDGGGDGIYLVTVVWRGNMEIPSNDDPADDFDDCGRLGQPGNPAGTARYGETDLYRRSLTLPVYITARRPN